MNKRIAKKICSRSAWVEVKCMPYSSVPHRGGCIKAAIKKLRKLDLPVFYYEKKNYKPTSFSESYWVDTLAKYNQLMLSARL